MAEVIIEELSGMDDPIRAVQTRRINLNYDNYIPPLTSTVMFTLFSRGALSSRLERFNKVPVEWHRNRPSQW
jgi:hypothetical protein